jgi:hypothetical protein
MSKELLEMAGKWVSIAVILAATLYFGYDIWKTQMDYSHNEVLTLIGKKTCEN